MRSALIMILSAALLVVSSALAQAEQPDVISDPVLTCPDGTEQPPWQPCKDAAVANVLPLTARLRGVPRTVRPRTRVRVALVVRNRSAVAVQRARACVRVSHTGRGGAATRCTRERRLRTGQTLRINVSLVVPARLAGKQLLLRGTGQLAGRTAAVDAAKIKVLAAKR